MYWTLAVRHLLVRPGRAAVLLIGYSLGVAVMIVLLSVGDAMVNQSRDATLIAGGELTVLPHGVDIEAMRTGGLAGMFYGIDGARFVSRQMLAGPRQSAAVLGVSPVLDQKLLTVQTADTTWSVRAGAEIPSMATLAGSGLRIERGTWADSRVDSEWVAPGAQAFYDEIDRFHRAPAGDSSWAEWHYFNLVVSDNEWWYVTLLVGGDPSSVRSGGQVLVTHRRPDGHYDRYASSAGRNDVRSDTATAQLRVGSSMVMQRDGVYGVRGRAGITTFEFSIAPAAHRYFPPVQLGDDRSASGYVVPVLAGSATGKFCVASRCAAIDGAAAYHDHNWGLWRAVTWEWGSGRGGDHALLYGGIVTEGRGAAVPFFLALEDSLGVQQIYRFDQVTRFGQRDVPGMPGIVAPDSMTLLGQHGDDSLRVVIRIEDAAGAESLAAGPGRVFLQMRGAWTAAGTAAGLPIRDGGYGFFETWVRRKAP